MDGFLRDHSVIINSHQPQQIESKEMKKQRIIFSLLSFIQFVSSQHEELQLHFRKGECLKSDNVASNSTYSKNIVFLFSNLTSLSSTSKFSTFSAGSGRDQVNGLYLCRPDLSPESCHKCISTSANDLLVNCANKKEAIQWYDQCMFRYTNRSIFSTKEIEPWTSAFDPFFNVSQPQVFPTLLNRTMQGLIAEAVSPKNNLRFATGHANFTVFEGLYGMVLCTRDITGKECENCLRTALGLIPTCCGGLAQWTMVLLPSCQLRYDTAQFIFPPSPSFLA